LLIPWWTAFCAGPHDSAGGGDKKASLGFWQRRRESNHNKEDGVLAEGTVKWFSDKKGYGFIERNDGSDVFVHHSSIDMPGFRTLSEGEKVSFELEESDRGCAAKSVMRT
jgi:CspA family cold shock protein